MSTCSREGLTDEQAIPGWAAGDRSLLQIGIWPLHTVYMLNMLAGSKSNENSFTFLPDFCTTNNKVNNGKNIYPMARDTVGKQSTRSPIYQQKLLKANQTDFYK
jgi:hypothetical protein